MQNLSIKANKVVQRSIRRGEIEEPDYINVGSPEEKVNLLIIRDLKRLNWNIQYETDKILITPPEYYDKEIIRKSMSVKRLEMLHANSDWIKNHIGIARENLADGLDVIKSRIKPVIEVCKSQKQHDLFRILRYYWSSPSSDYVGRRIRLLVRDEALPDKPVIGLAALGSPIIHIPDRDDWIGWDVKNRSQNLVYTMDAYILGALPPYNYLLGGKLISYIITSNEVRDIYHEKYKDDITLIQKRKVNDLVCIFTTSLYGKSSQYNRLKYKERLLYVPIGETKGYGTFHLSDETFSSMRELLNAHNIIVENRFGDGPIWRMRVIRTVAELLGFDANFLLRHSFKRSIYAVPLAKNYNSFLNGESDKPEYYNLPLDRMVKFWKTRWFFNRKKQSDIVDKVVSFRKDSFNIL